MVSALSRLLYLGRKMCIKGVKERLICYISTENVLKDSKIARWTVK